jgi:hypothetical protein
MAKVDRYEELKWEQSLLEQALLASHWLSLVAFSFKEQTAHITRARSVVTMQGNLTPQSSTGSEREKIGLHLFHVSLGRQIWSPLLFSEWSVCLLLPASWFLHSFKLAPRLCDSFLNTDSSTDSVTVLCRVMSIPSHWILNPESGTVSGPLTCGLGMGRQCYWEGRWAVKGMSARWHCRIVSVNKASRVTHAGFWLAPPYATVILAVLFLSLLIYTMRLIIALHQAWRHLWS